MIIDRCIQLAAEGDISAFEEIYRSHYRRVYTQCLRMTRSSSEAEDLTQDVFVQLYRKLRTFRGESAFSTWLHRLTANVVLMHFRKIAARIEQKTDSFSDLLECRHPSKRAEATLMLDRISLDEAIQQLSPGYRAVLILHDVEGYEHQQISEFLGCAVGTSKSQLHKARKKLRDLLRKKASPKERPGYSFGLLSPIGQIAR